MRICTFQIVKVSFFDTRGISAKWNTDRVLPALLHSTDLLKIWQYVSVVSFLWMLEHFPEYSFRLFCFILEEVKMCLRDTGLMNKQKELEKQTTFHWFQQGIVNSYDDVCLPLAFLCLGFWVAPFPRSSQQIEWQHGRKKLISVGAFFVCLFFIILILQDTSWGLYSVRIISQILLCHTFNKQQILMQWYKHWSFYLGCLLDSLKTAFFSPLFSYTYNKIWNNFVVGRILITPH